MPKQEYLELGSTPSGEDCAQVGADNYTNLTRIETRLYIEQLRRQFGMEPDGARIAVKSFPHDFGTYHEVVCYYYEDNEASVEYAFQIEGDLPEYWDNEAEQQLLAYKNNAS